MLHVQRSSFAKINLLLFWHSRCGRHLPKDEAFTASLLFELAPYWCFHCSKQLHNVALAIDLMRDSGMKFHAKPEGKWLCRVNVKVKAISKKRWFSAHNLGRFLGPEGGTLYNGLYGKVEWYMKGYGVGPRGGAFPHKSLLCTPPPPPHRVFKISVKSRLNYCYFYGVKRGG